MNMFFWKTKKNRTPSLKSLRPVFFNVRKWWFVDLGVILIILGVTMLIGFRFFYTVYFESYKESDLANDFENLIDVSRLHGVIEKRAEFMNTGMPPMPNPSI